MRSAPLPGLRCAPDGPGLKQALEVEFNALRMREPGQYSSFLLNQYVQIISQSGPGKTKFERTAISATFDQGADGESTEWEEVEEESLEDLTVADLMTTEIVSVAPHLPVPAVAALLAERHLHRVFVAAEHGPVGVISTMDVLRALSGSTRSVVRA